MLPPSSLYGFSLSTLYWRPPSADPEAAASSPSFLTAALPGSFLPPISVPQLAFGSSPVIPLSSLPPLLLEVTSNPEEPPLPAKADWLIPGPPSESCWSTGSVRSALLDAGSRRVALEVSVVLLVVELDGCCRTPRSLLVAANVPPSSTDSAASESDVTTPGFSTFGSSYDPESVVT